MGSKLYENFSWPKQLEFTKFVILVVLVVWKRRRFGHFRNFPKFQHELTWKTLKKINFWVLQIYLVQMNPGDVLVIGRCILLVLRKVYFFRNFPKCQLLNYRIKPKKKILLSFPKISSSNEPKWRGSHWKRKVLILEKVWFFRKFPKCHL